MTAVLCKCGRAHGILEFKVLKLRVHHAQTPSRKALVMPLKRLDNGMMVASCCSEPLCDMLGAPISSKDVSTIRFSNVIVVVFAFFLVVFVISLRQHSGTSMKVSRREWILGSLGVAAWSSIASAHEHAQHAVSSAIPVAFAFFDASAAQDVTAIAAQIVPSDDGPGATEAGAVYFIDRALTTFAVDKQPAYRDGLADLKVRRESMFPSSSSFSSLAKSEQVALLRSMEKAPFYELVRTHTVLGWLGGPEYGGNRDQVGWKYIGFEDAGFFDPPFGHYDAEGK